MGTMGKSQFTSSLLASLSLCVSVLGLVFRHSLRQPIARDCVPAGTTEGSSDWPGTTRVAGEGRHLSHWRWLDRGDDSTAPELFSSVVIGYLLSFQFLFPRVVVSSLHTRVEKRLLEQFFSIQIIRAILCEVRVSE